MMATDLLDRVSVANTPPWRFRTGGVPVYRVTPLRSSRLDSYDYVVVVETRSDFLLCCGPTNKDRAEITIICYKIGILLMPQSVMSICFVVVASDVILKVV